MSGLPRRIGIIQLLSQSSRCTLDNVESEISHMGVRSVFFILGKFDISNVVYSNVCDPTFERSSPHFRYHPIDFWGRDRGHVRDGIYSPEFDFISFHVILESSGFI